MTPVNGRIELRPRKGEGSLGVHFLQAVERPIWGARASSLQEVTRPGRFPLFFTRFWPKGSLPPLLWGRTASAPKYADLRRPGSTVVIHSTLDHYSGVPLLYSTGMINAAAHVAALLPPVRVAERAPRVLAGTPNFYASTVGATSLLYPLGTNYTRRYTCPFRRHLSPWRYVHTRTSCYNCLTSPAWPSLQYLPPGRLAYRHRSIPNLPQCTPF